MNLGQLVTGSEDEFLSIYERHVRNDPTAAWLKASYLEAKIWEGEISYGRFSEEIIDLYKTAMDSGLHAAMRSMAEVLNFGVIVEEILPRQCGSIKYLLSMGGQTLKWPLATV